MRPTTSSKRAEVWYREQMELLIAEMKKAAIDTFKITNDALTTEQELLVQRQLSKATEAVKGMPIDFMAKAIASGFVGRGNKQNKSRLQSQLANVFGVDIDMLLDDSEIKSELDLAIEKNVNLIKSIQTDFINSIGDKVRKQMAVGERSTGLIQLIHDEGGVSLSRAKFIARDQTSKLTSDLNKARHESLGLDLYYWGSTGDNRERESHGVLNKMLCKYSDPTIYSDDDGKTWKSRKAIGAFIGKPGDDYQCRCTAAAKVVI